MTKADLQKQIDALQKQLDEMKDEFPGFDDEYWYVVSDALANHPEPICTEHWMNNGIDRSRLEMGNLFATKAEAERYKLRLESMAVKWMPKSDETYYAINNGIVSHTAEWDGDSFDHNCYNLGRTFKTEEDAELWLKKYKEAWTTV